MTTAYQEQVFFFYILKNQVYLITTKPEFFQNKNLRLAFEIAKEHAIRYKECPSKDQMIQLVDIKGAEELSLDMIESIYNTESLLQNYDKEWLDEHVGAWIQIRNLDHTFRRGISYLKTTHVNADNASEVVENIRHMMVTETAIDFEFKSGSNFFDPAAHLQTRLARTPTGYPYIDKCLKGGFWKGSLIAFLAGPKAGKSLWMQNLAAQSVLNGFNTVYITLELQEELVHMRIGSNLLNINIDEYEDKAKDQDFMRKKLNKLKQDNLKPVGYLSVKEFPSSTASVNDVRAHIKKEEEILGIKFENIFIDYINIMKNWRNQNTENTYMKIKQISEDLRAMAMEETWAVITVTQTNRGGWETSDLNLGNISESAALIHTVDGLFGIITTPEMKAKKIYYLKYLADRVSGLENTRKLFDVDFKFGRIEENTQSNIEDLDSFIKSTSTDLSLSRTIGNQGIPELQEPKVKNIVGQDIVGISTGQNLKWE